MKQYFESREYQFLDTEKNQFFSTLDNCLYEIRQNTLDEISKNKGTYSLYNLSKDKRISGLYEKKGKNPNSIVFTFDYLNQVYYLELIPKQFILIQFLHFKEPKKTGFIPKDKTRQRLF